MKSLLSILFFFASTQLAVASVSINLDQLKAVDGVRYFADSEEPFSGTAVGYYEDGTKQIEVNYQNGVKDGKEVGWYDDGQLQYVVRYSKGMPQGLGSSWYRKRKGDPKVQGFLRCEDQQSFAITCAMQFDGSAENDSAGALNCGDPATFRAICGDLAKDEVEQGEGLVFCDGREDLDAVCPPKEEVKQEGSLVFCDGREDMEAICGKEEEQKSNQTAKFQFCDGSPEMKSVCGK